MGVDRSAWLVGPVLFRSAWLVGPVLLGERARLLGSEGRWVLIEVLG